MWSFFRNQKSANRTGYTVPIDQEKRQRPKSMDQLIADMGDISDLAKHDVAVKFWLPEPVKSALEEIRQLTEQSSSSSGFLRQFLVIHCYGFYPYLVMLNDMPNFCKDFDGGRGIMFSKGDSTPEGKIRQSTYWVADLGKNIAPIKLWVPSRLKQDLSILAEHSGLTLSNYIREIVISRLLGHGMLPKRPEMLILPTPNLDNWIEDGDLHWTEVDHERYLKYPINEIRDTWLDDSEYTAES